MLASSAVYGARSTGSKRAATRPDSSREKSSSVLTSFSSRWALRWTTLDPLALRAAAAARPVGERVLGGAEQQRQRSAELVADVGEERGLGAVELGERLGPAALGLVGAGGGDARPRSAPATSSTKPR